MLTGVQRQVAEHILLRNSGVSLVGGAETGEQMGMTRPDDKITRRKLFEGSLGIAAATAVPSLLVNSLHESVVSAAGGPIISTIAGGGSQGDNGPALSANLGSPWGGRLDSAGNIYFAI